MNKIRVMLALVVLSIVVSITVAQDSNIPIIAFLKLGDAPAFNLAEQGTLDLLAAYGFVDGDNIEIIQENAAFSIDNIDFLVDLVLERNVDVLITSSTPVTVSAIRLTNEMENPPAVIFNVVTSVFSAGIADAPCLKAEHVTGSQTLPPFDLIMPLLNEIDPDIDHIGVIYNQEEPNSVVSVNIINDVAATMDIEVFAQSINSTDLVYSVAEGMIMSGIDAFLIPTDTTAINGLPDISAAAAIAGIPVITATPSGVNNGATYGIGYNYYQDGIDSARIAIHYLNGGIDIATTAINNQTGLTLAVNMDVAASQSLEVVDSILARADFIIDEGESTEIVYMVEEMSLEDRVDADTEFLDTLYCSPDRIEEEQAALIVNND